MKPEKQVIPINFSGGLDLKNDPWQVGPTDFLALNNMVFTTGGRLTKRNGFPSKGKTVNSPNPSLTYSVVPATLNSARKIMAYKDELLLNDAFNLYSYDGSTDTWNYKGRSTILGLGTESIIANSNTYIQCDSSIDSTSGIRLFAYSDGSDTFYSIQDIETGQLLINKAQMGSRYVNPRCVSISGKSWITAISLTDGNLYYQAFVGNAPSGSPTSFITDINKSYTFSLAAPYNATAGATYTNNGQTFTVLTTIAAGNSLSTRGTGNPISTGNLIKASGTGDSPITFASYTLNNDLNSYDIDVDSNTGNIYIAYYNSSGGITVSAISSSFVIGNTITKSESASNGVSWFGDGSNIWVVYNNGSATKGFIVNNAVSSTTLAPTTIDSGATAATVNNVTGVYSSTFSKAFIFYDPITITNTLTASAAINFNTMTVAGTVGTPTLFMGSVSINSKAFAVSGIPHILATYTYSSIVGATIGASVVQPTHFLLNLYNVTPSMGGSANDDVVANIAAKISPDEAAPFAPSTGRLRGVHQNSSGSYECSLLQNSNFGIETQNASVYAQYYSPTGVINSIYDFSLSNPDAQDLGNNQIIASGEVVMYDGASVVEQNFHIYPNGAAATPANVGGSMGSSSANTLYGYIYLYEWIDNKGQVHRSFPSPVVNPLAAGQAYTFASGTTTGSVSLTIPMLRVTNKSGSDVVVNIYRTTGNGSIYYLLGSFGTVTNDPSVNSVTYVDTASDSAITSNLQIYTTGDLGYFAPPAAKALSSFKNRSLLIPFEGGYNFLFSNQVLQNFPVQYVPFFDLNIGTIAGQLVTLAGMDDKIIIFKSGKIVGPAILYIVGTGPSASGASNDFTDPLPVAVDVGCVDRSSIVMTPDGLIFKSEKGIYLLNRGLQAAYIGAPVESYNQYSVLSAQLIPDTTQVRFILSNGTMLMYDYFYKRWATFSCPAGISDCIFEGKHTYVASDGTVYQESPGVYYDGTNTPVLMSFTTSWIKLAGIQGYQRAYWYMLLGEYLSSHQLSVSTYLNFSDAATQTNTITPSSTNFLENWRGFFANQRCQSFQVAVTEVYSGTLGASFTMSAISLVAGIKSPFRTFSSAQTVG